MAIYVEVLAFIGVMLASTILVYKVRDHALKKGILDIPNARSSHKIATPRGGGLGFVIPFLFSVIVLGFLNIISTSISLALVGGGSVVAVLGWLDDKAGLSAWVRAIFQFLAAAWAVFWLGGFPTMSIGFVELHLSWIGSIAAIIGTVWMINLYNFMDGIDGIAGTEAISVALIAGGLLLLSSNAGLVFICVMLASSVAGFLLWNWPPAKIFMGDIGSGFLGFVFACLAIASEKAGAIPLVVWIMLLGVFVIDATCTLIERVSQRKKWYEAHRSHVYQRAVQVGYSHKQVTLMVLAINCGLGIIAYWVLKVPHILLPVSLTTALILVLIHIYLRKYFMKKIEELDIESSLRIKQSLLEVAATDNSK